MESREEGINRIEHHSKERCNTNKMDYDEAEEEENIVRARYGRVPCESETLML